MIGAVAASARAESPAIERTVGVSAGLSVFGDLHGEPLPFVTGQLVWDRFTRVAAVAEASFFTTGDRQFGPRLFTSAGARWYVLDRGAGPFIGANVTFYHQWDVVIDYSDSSQDPGTSLGGGASFGHELVARSGLTWTAEATVMELVRVEGGSGDGIDGFTWHLATTLGYRF